MVIVGETNPTRLNFILMESKCNKKAAIVNIATNPECPKHKVTLTYNSDNTYIPCQPES